jgi:glyoxylase-like metal-dependent hydrolase (beta-lactamase superfamily II)
MINLNVETFPMGPIRTNCYLVWPENSKKCWVIDPGGSPEAVINSIQAHQLEPEMIILTHGHWDHFIGNADLKVKYPDAQIAIHRADAEVLPDANKNLSVVFGMKIVSPPAEVILQDGDHLQLDTVGFKVIHTPGHAPGGVCLYSPDTTKPTVFVGDLIFAGGGVGRTDLPHGSTAQLYTSIAKLFKMLPDETIVYSGHGPSTTIGEERPYLEEIS